MKFLCFFLLTVFNFSFYAQKTDTLTTSPKKVTLNFSGAEGVIIGGYVDNGAFINFTGPNISISTKYSKFIFGMLPSLRYKEDNGKPKNSPIMPGLGAGITYCYKKIAFQIPLYYNPKTALKNGEWQIGFGIGLKIKK